MQDMKTHRLAGMVAMLAGVASFSLMDAGLKLLSGDYPPMQVAALRGLSALPLVFAWAMYAGGPRQLLNVRWPLHLIRGVLSIGMMVTFVFGIQQLSLAKTYALHFAQEELVDRLHEAFTTDDYPERERRKLESLAAAGER